MIHKKKEFSKNVENRLYYMFRGGPKDKHEHSFNPEDVVFIGGNVFAQNPIIKNEQGQVEGVDIVLMAEEFNTQASMHQGKGEKLFGHYIISLAEGESLNNAQWAQVVAGYMKSLGYDNSTKYVSCLHLDSKCEHLHIATCRVKNESGGPLVADSNDYEKGFAVMRKYEKKFGLRIIENPEDGWGKDYSKNMIKKFGSRAKIEANEPCAIIRSKFKQLWSDGKPATMKELAERLRDSGVDVQVDIDGTGKPYGIRYKLLSDEDGKWFAGSRVMKNRATWGKLQSKEGISYDKYRDNTSLGLRTIKKPAVDTEPRAFAAYVMIGQHDFMRLKKSRKQVPVYRSKKRNGGIRARLMFNIGLSKKARYEAFKAGNLAAQIESMMKALEAILCCLFTKYDLYYHNENHQDGFKLLHTPDEFSEGQLFELNESSLSADSSTGVSKIENEIENLVNNWISYGGKVTSNDLSTTCSLK